MSRRLSVQYKAVRKQSIAAAAGAATDNGEDEAEKSFEEAKQKIKRNVKFPNELIFLDDIKSNNLEDARKMLRRTSVELDINQVMPSSGINIY
jgi:hypothetical protein